MFLKNFDMISPPLTLFYKGEGSHVSIYSGILSIIAYIIVVVAAFYYALGFINRDAPKAYFFTRYVEDAGTFPVNATQMFHFIQVSNPQTNKKVPLDFQAFRIVGFDNFYANDYSDDPTIIETKNHWVYGNCNNKSDTQGIGYLINQDYYEQSACIRQYYNAAEGKYYETDEDGFVWPIVIKGCSHPDRTYYGIIMQRCDYAPDLIKRQGPACKSTTEINNIISSVSFNFQIIDHYADMLNYEMPFTKYFYEITSALADNYFAVQHLNFNPANMLTHNGFFFDNQVREQAYFFTQNDKQNIEGSVNGCLIGVFYWMQNTLQYYERDYQRIQDVLSDIGGISSIVLTVAGILNLLIFNFIVILDTEDIVINTDKENFNSNDINKKPTIIRRAKEVMFPPPRRPYQARKPPFPNESQQNAQASSNYQRLMKDGVDIYPNMNFKDEKTEQYKNLYLKRSNNISNQKNIGNEYNKEGEDTIQGYSGYNHGGVRNVKNYTRGNYKKGSYQESSTNKNIIKDDNTTEKKEFDVEDIENRPLEKQHFNWCKFLGYLICCHKNDNRMKYFEDFRAKMISEENIIINYFDIYKLLKACNIKKTVIFSDENQ